MQQPDFQRFKAVMVGMSKLYEREIDKPLLDAYWLALRDWSLLDFESAAGRLMATSKFMPRPADFNELRRAGRPTAGEAFARAVEHAASSGYRSGPLGDDAIDRAARAIGGYVVIAMCDEDKLHFLERRFCEHYESIQDADEIREALPQLSGRTCGPQRIGSLMSQNARRLEGEANKLQSSECEMSATAIATTVRRATATDH